MPPTVPQTFSFFPLTASDAGSLMTADRRETPVAIGLVEEISQPSRFAPGRVVRKARRLFWGFPFGFSASRDSRNRGQSDAVSYCVAFRH